ncbi:hypothetical protein [Piscinibacter sakaiensis]|uniref:hypothetical protein n=1 Tax=Piscinibacter sakaiensis TaxID=1547922 RepID=UPI003AAA79A7
MIIAFNAFRLWLTLSNFSAARRIHYSRGKAQGQGKVQNLDTDVPALNRSRAALDCSGYVQYVIYQGSSHKVRIPQGSYKQQEWLEDGGCRAVGANDFVDQADVYAYEAAKRDDTVRIAFRATDPKRKNSGGSESGGVGHVWLVINARTYECTTRRGNGPNSFDFDARTSDVDSLYVLGPAPGFAGQGALPQASQDS